MTTIASWSLPGSEGATTVRLLLRWGDEMTFTWSSVPDDRAPRVRDPERPFLRRWVDLPSVTCWYWTTPAGWRPDPTRTLDAQGNAVRAFVDALTGEDLLAVCRRDAIRRLEEADARLFADKFNADFVRNVRHGRRVEVAALSIEDPQVRRTAMQMRLTWTGSPGELIAAADGLQNVAQPGRIHA